MKKIKVPSVKVRIELAGSKTVLVGTLTVLE